MGICTSQTRRRTLQVSTPLLYNIRQFYRFGELLGQGSFGTVRLGYRMKANKHEEVYAIKTINKIKVSTRLYLLRQEFEALRKLDHPNIIRFLEMYEDQQFIYFVMEHCSGGDLLKKLLNQGPFPEERVRSIMSRLFSACAYMHNQGFMHRDLKPENVLLSSNKEDSEIKIIDFGLSKKLKAQEQESHKNSRVGTPLYVAPEVIQGKYDSRCDDWSLGCIMYVLICGEPPFYSENLDTLLQKIQFEDVQFPQEQWNQVSVETRKIVQRLLQKDPQNRLTSQEIIEMDWFKNKVRSNLILNLKKPSRQQSTNYDNQTPVNTCNIRALKNYAECKRFKKEILRILIKQLSQKQLEKMTGKFLELDVDNNGYISIDELSDVINKLGYHATEQEIQHLIKGISSSENTPLRIKYTQFLAATIDKKLYLTKERLWSLFRFFDMDNKNYITVEDMKQVFKREGRFEVDCQKIISEVQNKDGKIEFKDFCLIMHGEMQNDEFFNYFESLYSSPQK